MYRGIRDETYKKIEFIPIKFLLFKNTLYLHSFKPEDHGYRNYNVSRFKPKTLLSSDRKIHFKLPENKWASLRENSFGIVYVGKVKKVKLEFLPKAVKHVKDRKWHFKPNILFKQNGNMVMEMDLYITTELISEIMRWMPNVIVHKPSELINKVKKRLMDSLTNNKWNIA